jgi:hypothetical protein
MQFREMIMVYTLIWMKFNKNFSSYSLHKPFQCFGQKEIKESDPEPSADNAGNDRG